MPCESQGLSKANKMKKQTINGHIVFFSDTSRRKNNNGYKCAVLMFAPNELCYRAKIFTNKAEAKAWLNTEVVPTFIGSIFEA